MSTTASVGSGSVDTANVSISATGLSSPWLHRYNQLMPSTHPSSAILTEGAILLSSILKDLREAASSTRGQVDFVLAVRQIKRLHALDALKYALPDAEWKEIVETMMQIALTDGITLPRQSSLFGGLNRLLSSKRDITLLTIAWRPLWYILQSVHLSHVTSRASASGGYTGTHLKQLVALVRHASRCFAVSAVHEIVATCTASLSHTMTHAMFNAQALLYLFLPASLCVADLPPGTPEHWMRIWSWVDHCKDWDAIWAALFARLAHSDAIADVESYNAQDGTPKLSTVNRSSFPWGSYIPFFASKLQAALRVPVAGGQPVAKVYPYESAGLLSGVMPNGIDAICKLLVRVMTVKIPPSVSKLYGDDKSLAATTTATSTPTPDPLRKGVGDASALGHIERLLRALSSFFYPTSTSSQGFTHFLRRLTQTFNSRVGHEAGAFQAAAVLKSSNVPLPNPEDFPAVYAAYTHGGTPPISRNQIVRFVDVALPLAVLGLYSGKGQSGNVWETSIALKCLAVLAPARVTKEVVNMASMALDPGTVNQTHQAPNAFYALSILTRPLLFPVPQLAPSLPDLLHASLPGIDPNDNTKTSAALSFYATIVSSIPLLDADDVATAAAGSETPSGDLDNVTLPAWHPASPQYTGVPVGAFIPPHVVQLAAGTSVKTTSGSDAIDFPLAGRALASGPGDVDPSDGSVVTVMAGNEAEEEEGTGSSSAGTLQPAVRDLFLAARDATPRIGEWALLLVDRIFRVLEVREKPQKKSVAGQRGGGQDPIASNLYIVLGGLFTQCSPKLLKGLMDRIFTWLSGVSCLDGIKDIAKLLECLAVANPEVVLKKFLPHHVSAATAAGTSDKTLEWHARLLAGLVRSAGSALTPYVPSLTTVIRAAFASKEKSTRKAGGKLLRWILNCLLSTYDAEQRSHAPEDWAQPGTLWRKWAQPYQWLTPTTSSSGSSSHLQVPAVSPSWRIPSAQDRLVALELVNEFLVTPMLRTRIFTAGLRTKSIGGSASSSSSSDSSSNAMNVEGTDGSTSSTPAAAAAAASTALPPAVIKAEAEKLVVDLSMILAAIRGGVYALTDGMSERGDDDIICIGTTGQALIFDATTGKAHYAGSSSSPSTSSGSSLMSLRHALAFTLQAAARGIGNDVDYGREVQALKLLVKVSYRLVAARGPKMSKTVQARNDIKAYKSYYREPGEQVRVSQFVKMLEAAGRASGHPQALLPSTSFTTEGSTHQLARGYMIARLSFMMSRRVAESIYAVPRALHYGRSAAAIGELEADDAEEILETEEAAEVLEEDTATPLDVATPGPTFTSKPDLSSSDLMDIIGGGTTAALPPSLDLSPAIPAFGRRCISKVKLEEQSYTLLMASILKLSMHAYDTVRNAARSHVGTMLSVYGWMRKPAQLRALSRLDSLASLATSARIVARAPAFKAAAESYLSTHVHVATSSSSPKLPPAGISSVLINAMKDSVTIGPAAALPAAIAAASAVIAAASAGATASSGTSSATSDTNGGAGGVFFPEEDSGAGGVTTTTGTASGLLSPSVVAGGKPSTTTSAAPAPLDHAEVLGLCGIAFLSSGALIGEWYALERAVSVLLRSADIVRGLPVERHAEALRTFSYNAATLMYAWHAIPISPTHHNAAAHREVRNRLMTYLLSTACPSALPLLENVDANNNSNNNVDNLLPSPLNNSTTASGRVLHADGTRGLSAAYFPPSPLHWRYELLAGGLLSALLAPGAPAPCRLAIDSASHEESQVSPRGTDPTADGKYLYAPEAVWLWALSNVLSDNVVLRVQSLYALMELLHSHIARLSSPPSPSSAAAAADNKSLPRVRALLLNPRYMSQFVAAVSQNHAEQSAEGANGASIESALNAAGVRDLALPVDSVRAFVESSRHSLRGGATSSIPHMLLFELLYLAFPDILVPCVDALTLLGKGAEEVAAQLLASSNNASATVGASTEGEAGAMNVEGSSTTATATATAAVGHELATLRARQATVAEAFGGFMRAISLQCSIGGGDSVNGLVTYQASDATLQPAPSSGTTVASGSLQTDMRRVIALAAPMLETVSVDWASDWANAIRYLSRQRHPSQVAPLIKYVFANASNSIAANDVRLPASYDAAGFEKLLAQVSGASSSSAAPTASATVSAAAATSGESSSSSASAASAAVATSFAAQTRWLMLAQAFLCELFATADGKGCSGSLPGITCDEEEAAESGLHASRRALVSAGGVIGDAFSSSSSSIVPSRVATASLVRSLLPVLLRAFGHSYKSVREEIARTVMIAIESAWAPADIGATSPVLLPTVQLKKTTLTSTGEGGEGGWTDSGVPVLVEPVSTSWAEWVVPTIAALLHMSSGAARISGGGGGGSATKPALSIASSSTTAVVARLSDEEKWANCVLDTVLYFIFDAMGADTVVCNPALIPLSPITFISQNHPDREVSKLASIVMHQFAHTLTLRRANAQDLLYDAQFFAKVETALSNVSPSLSSSEMKVEEGQQSGASSATPIAKQSGADIMIRLLEAYGMSEDSAAAGTAGGGEEGDGIPQPQSKTTKTAAISPPVLMRSPIITAIQPIRTSPATTTTTTTAASSTEATTTTTTAATTTTGGGGTSTAWFVRRAVLSVITPMRARHLMTFTRPQDTILSSFVEGRLDDKQIEVQEAASETLIGFVMTMPTSARAVLASRLLALADSKLPKRPTPLTVATGTTTTGPTAEEAEVFRKTKMRFNRAIRKRHAGCLGVGAIAAAHPFDVPPYLAPVVAALSRHVGDPAPIAATVKKSIGEFRRTHADNWDAHKMAFTQDELDDVLAVTSGGSYFA